MYGVRYVCEHPVYNSCTLFLIGDKGLASVGTDMNDTLIDMLSEFVDDESELISVYYGEDIDENKAEELVSKIEEKFDGVDVELQYGGQPVYYYIVSVE